MSKKNKFKHSWSSQTNLGKSFGLSAIAIGKVLIKSQLKDPDTKLATDKALREGYAKSTPLKDGTPYFMWNTHKIKPLISKDHKELSKVEYWVTEVAKIMRDADKMIDEGNDKMGYMLADCAYEDVPENIREEVKQKVNTTVFGK